MNDLLTPRQLAAAWQTSVPTIYRLVREAGLPIVKLHDRADIRFDPDAVDAWLERRKVTVAS
jgi:excisionase family DNA binding protein